MKRSTLIRIVDNDTGHVEARCTLASFYRANEDIGDEWREEIENALLNWGAYSMGGGAAPHVRLELVTKPATKRRTRRR